MTTTVDGLELVEACVAHRRYRTRHSVRTDQERILTPRSSCSSTTDSFGDRCSRKYWRSKHMKDSDLSRGQELFPVRVWNEENEEKIAEFEYIRTIVDLPGRKRKPCVCQCYGICDARCHCMNEPFDTMTTEIAYDEMTGLLKKPSNWSTSIVHGVPRCIWECSAGCPCGPECSNRSAQLGLRYPFEIFMTKHKGWGVRPLRDIPAGAFVAEYAGVMKKESSMDYWSNATWYQFSLNSAGAGPAKYYLDASQKGNLTRFINHACVPNVGAINVFYDDSDMECGMHVGLFALRDVKAYQELTMDYGAEYWLAKMQHGEYCKCGRSCEYRDPLEGPSHPRRRVSKS